MSIDMLQPSNIVLPIFNQDAESVPTIIKACRDLYSSFNSSSGFIVASPEHNGQVSAFLKNTMDWISRLQHTQPSLGNPFLDKPVLLCGASTGSSGGILAIQSAKALFSHLGCLVLGDQLTLPFADQLIMDKQYDLPPYFEEQLGFALDRYLNLVNQKDPAIPPIAGGLEWPSREAESKAVVIESLKA